MTHVDNFIDDPRQLRRRYSVRQARRRGDVLGVEFDAMSKARVSTIHYDSLGWPACGRKSKLPTTGQLRRVTCGNCKRGLEYREASVRLARIRKELGR